MPEGRFLSRSIAVNRQLKNVSLAADYLFTRTIPHLDRDGRIDGDADVIRATVCPLRKEMTAEVIVACLDELEQADLIIQYVVDGQSVVCFPAFSTHQRGMKYKREQPSRLPPPPPNSGLGPDLIRMRSASEAEEVPDVADQVRASEVKLSEVKESKVKTPSSSSSSAREVLMEAWPDAYRDDLDALLDRVPEATAWIAELSSIPDGLHGPALPFDLLGRVVRDYNANGAEPNLRLFRGYVRDAAKPPTERGNSTRSRYSHSPSDRMKAILAGESK